MAIEFSLCCAKGSLHEGKAVGTVKTQFGVKTYVSGESHGDARNIVIYTDIFGIGLNNNLLIADRLADAGYRVFIPDVFDGDYFPTSGMNGDDLDWTAFNAWKVNLSPQKLAGTALAFLAALRESVGKDKFIGTIGHCFGAGFAVVPLTADGNADVGAIAHPSQTNEEMFKAVSKPLLISAAEVDPVFGLKDRIQAESILSENKIRFMLTLFSGVSHGFAVRGDISDPVVKYSKEKVLADQISWFGQF